MTAAKSIEFTRLTKPHLASLERVALRLTRDPTDAADLYQDTMLRAWRFWDRFEPGTNLKAWLHTILRNTFITAYHRAGRRDRFIAHVAADSRWAAGARNGRRMCFADGSRVAEAIGGSESTPPDPDEAFAAGEARAIIGEALEQLPDDYRIAVTLCDLEGFAYREIAAIMECPVGTVMSRLHRARRRLQEILVGEADEDVAAEATDPADQDLCFEDLVSGRIKVTQLEPGLLRRAYRGRTGEADERAA